MGDAATLKELTEDQVAARLGSGVWRRFLRHRRAVAAAAVIGLMLAASFLGPAIVPYDADTVDVLARFAPPLSAGHLLGTDELGRDVLARVMAGGQVSLTIGLASMAIAVVFGTVVGTLAGYYGGLVRTLLMRFVDAMLCFPAIFLLLGLAVLLQPGLMTLVVLIAATAWMGVARLVEAQVRSLLRQDYVAAARSYGAPAHMIILRELLPNAVATVIVASTLNVARAILLESYVSFLGYGIQPPTASWGNMLNNAQIYLTSAPWLAVIPGLAITLTVTSFNFVGDGLRDAFDSRVDLS